jgi:hypothetical protein
VSGLELEANGGVATRIRLGGLKTRMNFESELIKALPSLLVALLTVAAGWLVTQRLTYRWAIRQRRQESLLGATSQFYLAYGEFVAAWKLWNRLDKSDPSFVERHWEILQKAASADDKVVVALHAS